MALSIAIITGLSGSGKSTAIRALEDCGHYCIDNMPVALLRQLVDVVAADPGIHHLAMVIDIRERHFLAQAPQFLADLRQTPHRTRLIFFEASQDIVLRRYSQTRRLHPLDHGVGLLAAVSQERASLAPLRELADDAIDTSNLSPHALRALVNVRIAGVAQDETLHVGLMSFGFKYGTPPQADMMLDVRFLPNPYFVPELRPKSGQQQEVSDYVLRQPDAITFVAHTLGFLQFLLPQYQKEGKRYFTLAIGCTGGRHRSVSIVESLQAKLSQMSLTVDVQHRDVHMFVAT